MGYHLGRYFARGLEVEGQAEIGLAVHRGRVVSRLGVGEFWPGVEQPVGGLSCSVERDDALGVAQVSIVATGSAGGFFVVIEDVAGCAVAGAFEDRIQRLV